MKAVLNKMNVLIAAILFTSVSCYTLHNHYNKGYATVDRYSIPDDTGARFRSRNNLGSKFLNPDTKPPETGYYQSFLQSPGTEYVTSGVPSTKKFHSRTSIPRTYTYKRYTKRPEYRYYVEAPESPVMSYRTVHRVKDPYYEHEKGEILNYKAEPQAQTGPKNYDRQREDVLSYDPQSEQVPNYIPQSEQVPQYEVQTEKVSNYDLQRQQVRNHHPQGQQVPSYHSQGQQVPSYHTQEQQAPNYNKKELQAQNYHPQGQQETNYHPQGQQETNYHPQGQQETNYHFHRQHKPNYHPKGQQEPNYHPQGQQETNYHLQGQQEPNYHPQGQQKTNYHPQGQQKTNYHLQGQQETNYHLQGQQETNYHLQGQQEANNHPQGQQEPNYHPQGQQETNDHPQGQQEQNYHPQGQQASNYNSQGQQAPNDVHQAQSVGTEPQVHRQMDESGLSIAFSDDQTALTQPDQFKPQDLVDIIQNIPGSKIFSPAKILEEEHAGSTYSTVQNPLLDLIQQSAAQNYVPKMPTDFFDFLRDSYPLPKGFKWPLSTYDYVIVGAGSAGSVLASRLTEDKPRATVLLIEAGKPEMLLTDVPALAPAFQATNYASQYYMEHQPGVCMGMINQRCFWPRGRAVGGTSVINYMIYTRGRPQEWDRIAADGNYGWSYNEVLKYYIKSEKANLRNYTDLPYRGRDGKQSVEFVPFRTKLVNSFLEAGRLLGHPTVDYNDPDSFGFGYVQSTMTNGHRQSTARAYLHPHKRRRNLHILPEAYATKVLIKPKTKRAYGVEYVRNRLRYRVMARREVILSAGPIASPQLLMLSGIGPEEDLRSHNIPLIQNLNVGRTLYDHITFPGIVFKLNTTNVSLQEGKLSEPRNFKPIAAQWFLYGNGPLTSPGGVEGIGYIKTHVSEDPELVPDIELIDIGGSIASDSGGGGSQAVRKGMRIRDDVFNSAFGPVFAMDTWTAFPMLLHPKSKGHMELRDSNPFSFPKLYGNYLTDWRDVATFIAAIRHVIALAETEPFQKFGATLHPADLPTCRQHQFNTDEYWECAVRTLTATLHHQIATCKMGPITDPDAVVDPELRVHGIQGLRVVDSSIIPRTTSAHTNAPAMMIGEKAADLIKRTWRSNY